MGTTADKLQAVLASKSDIKAALTEKDQSPTDVFSTYADLIRNIETSVFGNYVWRVYDVGSLELLGLTVGATEDAYPTAGSKDGRLYVRYFESIEELSWEQINEIAHSGYADTFLTLKDSKTVTLTTGEEIELEIIGFNHDTYTDGGTAPVSFFMKNCLNTTRAMNSSNTNSGGWDSSAMYTWLQGTFYEQLPEGLKALVKPVDKKSSVGSQSTTLETISAKIWQLAPAECFSSVSTSYAPAGEGTLYSVFTDNASRIKMVNGSATSWWLRSPYVSNSTYFCCVYSDGSLGNNGASISRGVAVGLCI